MRGVSLLLSILALAACGPPAHDDRFVGDWRVDQPFHATYEASFYAFGEGGELDHLGDCAFGGDVPTGSVTDETGSVRCEFGDAWAAEDATRLVISGPCTDGIARPIVLAFPADASANAEGQAGVEVVSVGGQTGWGHFTFDWRWTKCGAGGCESAIEVGGGCPSP